MYNKELKTQFIREYTTSISRAETCVSAFEAMSPYEEEWGADFCTKSAQELAPVIEKLVGFRVRSRWQRIIVFQKYVKWCISHKVTGACDGMLHIDTVGLGKLRMQMVANPLQLQMYLNVICEPESEQTTDNIYRCFYWMAYSGMDEEDILKTMIHDVDMENLVVHCNGEEYEIYREAIPAFKNATMLTEFVYKHPNYPADKIVRRHRAPGDTVIRGIRSSISTTSYHTLLRLTL